MRKPTSTLILATFLISPFLSFLLALCNLKDKGAHIAIAGFFLLFGLTFVPAVPEADSFRYANEFAWFAINPDASFNRIYNIYMNHEGVVDGLVVKDLWVYCIYYISALVGGNNYHIFFFVVSLFFTFFCLRSLNYITSNQYFSSNACIFILALLFLYTNNIQNVNGVRFWTTAWIAVYITFKVVIDGKLWYALFLIPLPLMHTAFSLYWILFLGALLLSGQENFLKIFFIVSFLFSEIALQLADTIQGYLPANLASEIEHYTKSEEAVNKMTGVVDASKPLYAKVFNELPKLYELLLVYLLLYRRKYCQNKKFVSFVVAYFCLVNTISIIPSIVRFYYVGWPFLIYAWISEWPAMKKYRKVIYWAPIAFCYHFWNWIRFVIPTTHWTLYLSNPIHIIVRNLSPL